MRWVDGWLGFYLRVVETCGLSGDMRLHERKEEKLIKCKKFVGGLCKWGMKIFPSPSFLSQAENYDVFHLPQISEP